MKERKTIVKLADERMCSITLKDLESKSAKFEFVNDKSLISSEVICDLVLYSPSKQSNLGDKISKKLEKHIDELVNDVKQSLDIKQCYIYSSLATQKGKKDLKPQIVKDNNPYMVLYGADGFLESFYASVRNALAHGNIVKKGKFYYLYSVTSKESKDVPEKERKLTFLLKVYNFNGIDAYIEAFKKYN